MSEPKPAAENILARARDAGLEKAVAGFPDDVMAAAAAAANARAAFTDAGDPAVEPWPPMSTTETR